MGAMIAAAAITAIGAGASFMGASKNAKAAQKAAKKGIRGEQALYDKWSTQLDTVMDQKEDKLYNLGGIFDRFESTGAFGDTNTLRNLRKAQEDFSALAAGDFSAFEDQVRKSMSDALVTTVGTGSPIGSFAQLAADTQMNYRLQGIQTATGLTESLSNQANNLLGLEFGLMDQRFQVGYEMDASRTRNINALRTQQAASVGVDWQAAGMGISQIGSSIGQIAGFKNNQAIQQQSNSNQMAQISAMQRGGSIPQAQNSFSSGGYSIPTMSSMDYSMMSPDGMATSTPTPFLPADNYYNDDLTMVLPPKENSGSSWGSYAINGLAMASNNPYVQLGARIMSGK